MKNITLLLLFYINFIFGQTIISGTVTDTKGDAVIGANVFIKGTYDGASTNEAGSFVFTTKTVGEQTLIVSFLSYETYTITHDITSFDNIIIKLREDVGALDAVVLNVGTFEAGDNTKVTALKPLDIVTTASALGDFVGALQTLPGTSTVAEDGRLFVRGGEAEETQVFIDGIRVFTPYASSPNNTPTRGRYSPFLFKGITFSTGGYSAEYGQALSSVLLLNTIDEPVQEKTDVSLMSVGVGVGNTQKWKKSSLSANASYINLGPYQAIFSDRNKWNKPVEVSSGELVYRHKIKENGLLKLYSAFSYTDFDLIQEDINNLAGVRFGMLNKNLYFNGSYKQILVNDWMLQTGLSYTNDYSKLTIISDDVRDIENSWHAKLKLKKRISNRLKFSFGGEYFNTNFNEEYKNNAPSVSRYTYASGVQAVFGESEVFFSKKIAAKVGVRVENVSLLKQTTVSPRVSLAYKTAENSQVSLAYGDFYQSPRKEYLKFSSNFKTEQATHLIANYQYVKNKQTFRVEGYYKKYDNLVKYDTQYVEPIANYSSAGNGYAKGIDFFWRDNKNIKNTDYWVSYSFIDTERNYKNYPTSATPSYIAKHNLSIVGKYWINDWKSQVGISYNFATGRPYTNPNTSLFLAEKMKAYNSVSVNWAYLISPQKILYFSVSNAFANKNISGYQYANAPDSNGVFNRRAITPSVDRFFFVGFFWTISDDKKSNQLHNL